MSIKFNKKSVSIGSNENKKQTVLNEKHKQKG